VIRLVTVSGPPSSGKTSVLLKTVDCLKAKGYVAGVVKFDCSSSYDESLYEKAGIPAKTGLSGNLCPDHFYISNVEESLSWGMSQGLDFVIVESAGLCNRCSPHIKDVLSVCVIDNLSGVNTPQKIGPMLKLADIVVITKGDIVSQAEREIFIFRVKRANPRATIVGMNGITGQGAHELAMMFEKAFELDTLTGKRLRFSMPAALCSYCLGEMKIGETYQRGNVKKMQWATTPRRHNS
jgi:Ni2+-binding GTPase involved in maturation of urease and hydrogenase